MSEPRPGVDVPDHRGRIGLELTGRSLDRNPDVRVTDVELLASAWHVLRRTTLEYRSPSVEWETQQRDPLPMIRDGRIQDAKAIMLLQWAVLDGPFADR